MKCVILVEAEVEDSAGEMLLHAQLHRSIKAAMNPLKMGSDGLKTMVCLLRETVRG